jgi:GH18 family chitinase
MKKLRMIILGILLLTSTSCGGDTMSSSSAKNELTYLQVVEKVKNTIDLKAYDDFKLLFSVDETDAKITYESSNENAISKEGTINRAYKIEEVKLSANITYKGQTNKYDFNIKVMPKEKVIDKDKRITMAYLYSSKFDEKQMDKIDILNYSFGLVKNNKLVLTNDANLSFAVGLRSKGLKVNLAIGGWGADGFSDAVLTEESRETFANSIIDAVKKYNFSGVDLDWEFPGQNAGGLIKARSSDKVNFTKFIKLLRSKLKTVDENLLLTIAVGAGVENSYEIDKIKDEIDYMNLMTYDFGDWTTYKTTFHTNLYLSSIQPYSSGDKTVKTYYSKGMPMEKMILGAAFYGRVATTVLSEGDGTNMKVITHFNYRSYTDIKKELDNPESKFESYYDDVAKSPWIYDGETFISYDDERSLIEKCKYVNEQGLAGIMFWELSQDKSYTLLTTISENINKPVQ